MDATAFSSKSMALPRLSTSSSSSVSTADARDRLSRRLVVLRAPACRRNVSLRRSSTSIDLNSGSLHPWSGVYTVGDFMTTKEDLHVVKTTTTVDKGLVSDYDLLTLDSISGGGKTDNSMFPEVDCNWRTFNEVQKLLSKTNGKVVGDLMTPAPVVVKEDTNLEDAARLLLKTKYRRLPVVDDESKLVGIITRGNVVRAALQIKRSLEGKA